MSSYGFIAPLDWAAFRSIVALAANTPSSSSSSSSSSHGASTYAPLEAIRTRALVDVADAAGFSRGFYTAYERKGRSSIGVAGYKTTIHALDALYEMRWLQSEYRYDCVPRAPIVTGAHRARQGMLLALVERLLLGSRRWPGIACHTHPRSFPAHDGPLLLGALSPVETAMLAQRLPVWEALVATAAASSPMSDRIFERVRAAAGAAVGLVALHAML